MSCNILMLGENQTYVSDGSVQPSLSCAYTLCWQNCIYIGRPMPKKPCFKYTTNIYYIC